MAQLAKATHVLGEVLHANLGHGPNQFDGAAHVIGPCPKDIIDPNPHDGFAALGLVGQRLAPLALPAVVNYQLAVLQLGLIGCIFPFTKVGLPCISR